jgi:predicted DNA-binding transcriptional regulator AlpA
LKGEKRPETGWPEVRVKRENLPMKASTLPIGYVLGVLNREQAAEYVGVGLSLFDRMVADRRLPAPVVLSVGRLGWVQRELALAIAALPRRDQTGSGDKADHDKTAEEKFDAARKAAKAEKLVAQH